MRFLFVSAQLPGHLDWGGYLATAAELVRRGHDVIWCSGQAVASLVERAGVGFYEMEETGWRWPPPPPLRPDASLPPEQLLHLKQVRSLDQWLEPTRVQAAVNELAGIARAATPDLVVGEMFVAAAGVVAEMQALPLVVAGWPAPRQDGKTPQDGIVALARNRLEGLLAQFSVKGQYWTASGLPALRSPLLHVTFWSPTWYGGPPFEPQTRHVGGRKPSMPGETEVRARLDLPPPSQSPWVLITLGTSFNADPNFFLAAAHAAEQIGCLPILSMGTALRAPWIQEMQSRLPATAVVREFVDFADILPFTAAAIHHGGAGTTHAMVTHAVPQIVVPHAADQSRQASGVTRSGVGIHVPPKQVTVAGLVQALALMLPDFSPYREAAGRLQEEFDQLGGVATAADLMEAAVGPSGH